MDAFFRSLKSLYRSKLQRDIAWWFRGTSCGVLSNKINAAVEARRPEGVSLGDEGARDKPFSQLWPGS
jgi:hypothetical protein